MIDRESTCSDLVEILDLFRSCSDLFPSCSDHLAIRSDHMNAFISHLCATCYEAPPNEWRSDRNRLANRADEVDPPVVRPV